MIAAWVHLVVALFVLVPRLLGSFAVWATGDEDLRFSGWTVWLLGWATAMESTGRVWAGLAFTAAAFLSLPADTLDRLR